MIKNFKLFKLYKNFKIHNLCKEYHIKNYTINDDMSISVDGNVDLSYRNLKFIPIKFKEVSGHFSCRCNKLISLKNCPETVGGFYCSHNHLTSLKYCPETVGDDFDCDNNKLTSLEGCPKEVGGYFSCSSNNLTSLEGCPESVGGYFSCINNQITNFDGLPEFFERYINLYENHVYEIYNLFKNDPRCIYWIREFGAIQGDEVIRDRLEEVYHTLGMDIPKDIRLENYSLV